jgi:transposase
MNYLGLDVHKRDSYVAVIDDDGELVEEVRVENANIDDFAQEYQETKAVIEATGHYYTIYDTLDQYMDVVVADPGQTKVFGYAELKK